MDKEHKFKFKFWRCLSIISMVYMFGCIFYIQKTDNLDNPSYLPVFLVPCFVSIISAIKVFALTMSQRKR